MKDIQVFDVLKATLVDYRFWAVSASKQVSLIRDCTCDGIQDEAKIEQLAIQASRNAPSDTVEIHVTERPQGKQPKHVARFIFDS